MPRYRLTNNATGADLGEYRAAHEDDARDVFARDCGHEDFADLCESDPDASSDIEVTYVGD